MTSTSSPSATGPVRRGYAMHGAPSTSSRARPSARETTAVTRPRLSVSIAGDVEERERDLDHPLEVVDRDALVRRMDVLHAVREIEARQAALVEDVRVGRAAAEAVARYVPGTFECGVGEANDLVVALEPVALVALGHLRLHLAVLEAGGERERIDHLLHQLAELPLVVRTRLGAERAPLRDDVAPATAFDQADVRRRLVVETPEPEIGDCPRSGRDRRTPLFRIHPGVRGAPVEPHLERV